MPSRKKQPQQTRLAILNAAAAEFATHGYAGTGIGAIITRAELTKGALFHHFPDKRSLALAWISDILEPALEADWITPLQDISSLDSLRTFCRAKSIDSTAGDTTSCIVSLSTGSPSADPLLTDAVARLTAAWRAALAALIERGKSGGWIHPSIHPMSEATFLVSAFCGFQVVRHGADDDSVQRNCAASIEGYLETLRPQ
jgi:TetR/AcrR family transcriptional regulator, transcriptional repressor for nem operon